MKLLTSGRTVPLFFSEISARAAEIKSPALSYRFARLIAPELTKAVRPEALVLPFPARPLFLVASFSATSLLGAERFVIESSQGVILDSVLCRPHTVSNVALIRHIAVK
jgi:hypothetical protein